MNGLNSTELTQLNFVDTFAAEIPVFQRRVST